MEKILFAVFGGMAVLSSLAMITRKNPLSAALCLVACLLSLAGIYAMLGAVFVALLQVLVYAGAIMMLIIFVIMTVNLRPNDLLREKRTLAGSLFAGLILLYCFGRFGMSLLQGGFVWSDAEARTLGTLQVLGKALFAHHVLSFEIISVLLLVALVGIVILGKKQKDMPAAGLLEKEEK